MSYETKHCLHCNAPLEGVKYFCRTCWFILPAQLRIKIHRLHEQRKGKGMETILDKAKRILAK